MASGAAIYDDFTASDWPGEKWYRHLPAPGIWDPVTRVTCGGGSLTLEAKPFTLTCRDAHDNVKALIYSTAEVSPGERGLLTVETEMRVTTFGTERNPFGAEARRRAARLRRLQYHRHAHLHGVRFFRQQQPNRSAL